MGLRWWDIMEFNDERACVMCGFFDFVFKSRGYVFNLQWSLAYSPLCWVMVLDAKGVFSHNLGFFHVNCSIFYITGEGWNLHGFMGGELSNYIDLSVLWVSLLALEP